MLCSDQGIKYSKMVFDEFSWPEGICFALSHFRRLVLRLYPPVRRKHGLICVLVGTANTIGNAHHIMTGVSSPGGVIHVQDY